ncbi:hypothetical protein BDZ89DRAFT_885601, partial [Hymenopellis radicata]
KLKCDKSKLAKARAEMILHIEESQIAHMEFRDPREVWRNLESVHRAQGFATSLALRAR